MPDEINPYASPAILENARSQRVDGLRYLRPPALGLLIISALTAIGGMCFLPLLTVAILVQLLSPPGARARLPNIEAFLLIPNFLASYPMLVGAWYMRQGKNYRWAYASAVLACIPILTPFVYFGIPLGIWALVVLHRRDVREAFAHNKMLELARADV